VNDAEFGSLSREEFTLLTGIVDRLIESGAPRGRTAKLFAVKAWSDSAGRQACVSLGSDAGQ
jgi:hypothetical protein